tara:strand:+ start:3000 stop:3794 length:795 start_codon:yes stop_codon:yes gene_type:complete
MSEDEITDGISHLDIKDENIEKFIKKRAAKIIQKKYKKYKLESCSFLNMINKTNEIYIKTGSNSRSSKKVNNIHQWIEDKIKPLLPDNMYIKQEQKVPSNTKSYKKKCDIVVYKDDIPYIIFPVKYIMTTYIKNSNNLWENLQGELMSLKTKAAEEGRDLYIIPINIISNLIPNRERRGNENLIKNMEKLTYESTFKVYEKMKEIPSGTMENISPLCFDVISYIIDVEHLCSIGEKYDKCPTIIGFNKDTPYRNFHRILKPILH